MTKTTKSKAKTIGLEDFIDESQTVKTAFDIDTSSKMMDFAKLRVPSIAPDIAIKITKSIAKIRSDLQKL